MNGKQAKIIVRAGKVKFGQNCPLALVSGPCVIESEKLTVFTAEKIKRITEKLGIPFVFKASYDKGNRSNVDYYRGPGQQKGLKILAKIKKELDVPVVSDIHCRLEIPAAAEVLDILQIPAYLCQQTDLVVAAANTGKTINIKKGQFLAPGDMKKICAKAETTGNTRIIVTDRGSVFGYNNLVCDMRSFPIMRETGYPVMADITHVVRMPGPTSSDSVGGQPQFIAPLTLAACAAGCDALFLEVHPDPGSALCDAASMLKLSLLEDILKKAMEISSIAKRP